MSLPRCSRRSRRRHCRRRRIVSIIIIGRDAAASNKLLVIALIFRHNRDGRKDDVENERVMIMSGLMLPLDDDRMI